MNDSTFRGIRSRYRNSTHHATNINDLILFNNSVLMYGSPCGCSYLLFAAWHNQCFPRFYAMHTSQVLAF